MPITDIMSIIVGACCVIITIMAIYVLGNRVTTDRLQNAKKEYDILKQWGDLYCCAAEQLFSENETEEKLDYVRKMLNGKVTELGYFINVDELEAIVEASVFLSNYIYDDGPHVCNFENESDCECECECNCECECESESENKYILTTIDCAELNGVKFNDSEAEKSTTCAVG